MRAALLALLLSLAACGGSSDAAPGAGTGGGSGTDGGTGPGADGAGAAEAGGTLERLDATGDCAGLVPDRLPAPVTVSWAPPPGATCAGAITDGTGHLAVAAALPGGDRAFQVFAPDGTPRAAFDGQALAPEAEGFHALRVRPGPRDDAPRVEHLVLAPTGAVRHARTVSGDPAREARFAWSFGQDPAGGSLVLFQSVNLEGNHWFGLRASRFGGAGEPRHLDAPVATDAGPGPIFLAGGVGRGGESLALYQQSAFVSAAWLDASGGVVASAPLDAGDRTADALGDDRYVGHDLELAPLLDGSLALRSDGRFRRVYAPRAGRSGALPVWLAERAAGAFRFTRGNLGYAALPPPGVEAPGCAQAIDLVSPSGRLCGRVVLRDAGAGACRTGVVDQGWDGSVVRQATEGACTWRVWPRLLAR